MYETLYRFFTEEFAGMPDKSRAPKEPARKVDFKAMAAVRRLQANPELGEFRIHAALAQLGIQLSPRPAGASWRRTGSWACPALPSSPPRAAGDALRGDLSP